MFFQVVWSKTQRVGCGVAFCTSLKGTEVKRENARLVYCDYSPG